MALSGSFNTNAYAEGRYYTLSWAATQNISKNTSTINWILSCAGGLTRYAERTLNVVIDGHAVYAKTDRVIREPGNIAAGSLTVTHNTNGAKSFTASVQAAVYESSITCSGSQSFTLNNIPRASSISVGTLTMGQAGTITISKAAPELTHTITYAWGDVSEAGIASGKGYREVIVTKTSASSVSWTPPAKLANIIPYASSGIGTLICDTYSGNTKVGSKSINFTCKVPDSAKPTVNTVNVTVDNSANSVIAGWGLYVAGYSKAKVTASASGSYGSKITGYAINGGYSTNVNGETLNYTGGKLNQSGELSFSVTATDSRGRSSAARISSNITVYPYSVPSISVFSAERSAADKTKVTVRGDWDFSGVNGKNSASAVLHYKLQSAQEWTQYGSITKGTAVTLTPTFPEEASYNFRLVVTDAAGNKSESTASISTGEVLLDLRAGGKGLGIGKVAESDALEVGIPSKFFGSVSLKNSAGTLVTISKYILDIVYPIGSIYMSVKNVNPSTFIGGTWSAWGSGRVPVGVNSSDTDFATVEKTGGEKTHKLTINEMPSHDHKVGGLPSRETGTEWAGASGVSAVRSATTTKTGGGAAHNNLPPYITCYMFKRTA